ncbi:MAG: FHA domain-containing protein FhaB/FipA [Actinomadura sp.]
MTALTLTLIKLAFLAVLWLFVIAAVGVIRADLFGSRATARAAARAAREPRKTSRPPAPARTGRRTVPSKLVVTQGALQGTILDLGEAPITIGRANDSTLVVTDDYASSRHARIFAQNGQWIVEDLGSTNGTYLGRTRVTRPVPVPVGVPIRVGKTVLELRT